ncbi:hypothetical protein BsWGS_09955 [Bradybaena similaris]
MEQAAWLLAAVGILVIYLWRRRPGLQLPPSPAWPVPLIGHLFYLKRNARQQFNEWAEQCGDMFSIYIGGHLFVVLNGFDVIKEAFVKKADCFSHRPPLFIDQISGLAEKGIVFSSGQVWKEQKSVCLSILRSFGMGKGLLAEKIQEEVGFYLKCLTNLKGKPSNIRCYASTMSANIICSILIGHRFEYEDEKFEDLMQKLDRVLRDQHNINLVNIFPFLGKFPGDLFKAKRMTKNMLDIKDVFVNFLREKKRIINAPNDVYNLIDAYLVESDKKIQAGISTTLDDDNLTKLMMDLFGAGAETTSTSISWCILYLLNNPGVQDKLYSEIKEKVGTDRPPSIQDKPKLKYVNAVIMETLRLANIIPLGISHMCSDDVTLRGYTLPKGTRVISNMDSVFRDKATWGDDALNFRPERFIDDSGLLKIPEQFIPFGIGRRACVGEAIATMELFLCLSNMFQKFEFLPPNPDSIPPLDCHIGGIAPPKPFEVRVIERK